MKSLLLITSLFLAFSCTEQVSEELQDSAQASSASSSAAADKKLTFKLVHTMSEEFSHFMHDAESLSEECKVVATSSGLNAKNYDRTNTDIAKDCFLEVEEMDLFFQGANLQLTADEGMCEYISFRPFSFWQYQAGKTTKTLHRVECADVACSTKCGQTFETFTGDVDSDTGVVTADFDDFGSTTILEASEFCHFDHSINPDESEDAPNCDEGTVITKVYTFPGESDPDGDPTTNDSTCTTTPPALTDTEETECGGEYTACLAGPAEDLVPNFPDNVGKIIYNEDLSAIDESYELPSPDSKGYGSNMYIANYMRSCYDTTTTDKSNSALGLLSNHTADFLGYEVEGLRTLPDTSDTDAQGNFQTQSPSDGSTDYVVWSTAPFRGKHHTRPYYGFYCFDKAYDIKAQIRLFVREWDRNFPENYTYLNKTSDVGASTRYMDTRYGNTGTCGVDMDCYDNDYEAWNNKFDWDDFLNGYDSGTRKINSQCTEATTLDDRDNFPRWRL